MPNIAIKKPPSLGGFFLHQNFVLRTKK